ncbi:MAG: type II toxin-antitoxin system RelE/ParE family toxin [Legionella sp.]|nr:type II toxin-antitoxin system RelE/ParE family toxin [Legionella sp.]
MLSIIKNPNIGKKKKGDLSRVFVYKFKISHQEYLFAYE